jgi:hypothetical protein
MRVLLAVVATGIAIASAFAPTVPAHAQPTPCDGSDPNCVYVPYTCNYDVLCDAGGNVIPGPPDGSGVRLGNGQICAGNGCTRP